MNRRLRAQAASQNLSLMEYLLQKIDVITGSLPPAKRNNAPVKFAARACSATLTNALWKLWKKYLTSLL